MWPSPIVATSMLFSGNIWVIVWQDLSKLPCTTQHWTLGIIHYFRSVATKRSMAITSLLSSPSCSCCLTPWPGQGSLLPPPSSLLPPPSFLFPPPSFIRSSGPILLGPAIASVGQVCISEGRALKVDNQGIFLMFFFSKLFIVISEIFIAF